MFSFHIGLASLFCLAVAGPALADDANWSAFGSAGNFSNSKTVKMDRENVALKLDDSGVRVHAVFWFTNTGSAQTVRMGFPDYTTTANRDGRGKVSNVIRWFRSKVDGKAVAAKKEPVKGDEGDYRFAWVKTVRFAKGQTRQVTVDYYADHGFAGNGWIFDTYILKTGSTWLGPIARGSVTIDWTELDAYSKPEFDLGSGLHLRELDGHHATVTFTNLKPKDDIAMSMVTGFFNFTMNGVAMDNGLGLPAENDGPVASGRHSDLRIPIANLGTFFALRKDGENADWQSAVASKFGHHLTLPGGRTVILGTGRKCTLRRPISHGWVYLRDLVEALGGSYRYEAKFDRVDLRLPK